MDLPLDVSASTLPLRTLVSSCLCLVVLGKEEEVVAAVTVMKM